MRYTIVMKHLESKPTDNKEATPAESTIRKIFAGIKLDRLNEVIETAAKSRNSFSSHDYLTRETLNLAHLVETPASEDDDETLVSFSKSDHKILKVHTKSEDDRAKALFDEGIINDIDQPLALAALYEQLVFAVLIRAKVLEAPHGKKKEVAPEDIELVRNIVKIYLSGLERSDLETMGLGSLTHKRYTAMCEKRKDTLH